MLHKNVQMVDIDVDHWRNLQEIFLESGKEKRRIVVIHDNGKIRKFVHSDRESIVRSVTLIDDPQRNAEKIFKENADKTDFVMILERRAVERYFAEVQDAWSPNEDLDVYVNRMYAKLADYADGIVTYPGPPRINLGLQWRIGMSYEGFQDVVAKFVAPTSTAIFALFDEAGMWATLVLGFDAEKRINLITSVASLEGLSGNNLGESADRIIVSVESKYLGCSVGFFAKLEPFREWIQQKDKIRKLHTLVEQNQFLFRPVPQQLTAVL